MNLLHLTLWFKWYVFHRTWHFFVRYVKRWAHAFSGRAVAIPAFQKFFHVIALTHLLTPYITDITCPLAPLLKPVLAIRSNHVLRLVSPSTDLPPGPTFGYHKFAQFFNVSHFHLWLIFSAWRKKSECPSLELLEQNFARGSTKFGIFKNMSDKAYPGFKTLSPYLFQQSYM